MDFFAGFIDAMEAAVSLSVFARNVIAVVRKSLPRSESRSFSDDLISFDHSVTAVFVFEYPFSAQQSDGPLRPILDRDEIDECVRLIRRKAASSVVVDEFVESGDETGKGNGGGQERKGADRETKRTPPD